MSLNLRNGLLGSPGFGLRGNVLPLRKKIRYILDIYPNVAFALSLRLLRSDYNGYCIEIRRSSDNAIKKIGFVNNMIDIDSLISFVGSGSAYVKTWYDQSINKRDFIQPNNSYQPSIIVNGKLILLNSKPAIFNNAQSIASINLYNESAFSGNITAFTIWMSSDIINVIPFGSCSNTAIYYGAIDSTASQSIEAGYTNGIYYINNYELLVKTRNALKLAYITNKQVLSIVQIIKPLIHTQIDYGAAGYQGDNYIQEHIQFTTQQDYRNVVQDINNYYAIF